MQMKKGVKFCRRQEAREKSRKIRYRNMCQKQNDRLSEIAKIASAGVAEACSFNYESESESD